MEEISKLKYLIFSCKEKVEWREEDFYVQGMKREGTSWDLEGSAILIDTLEGSISKLGTILTAYEETKVDIQARYDSGYDPADRVKLRNIEGRICDIKEEHELEKNNFTEKIVYLNNYRDQQLRMGLTVTSEEEIAIIKENWLLAQKTANLLEHFRLQCLNHRGTELKNTSTNPQEVLH